MQEEQTSQDSRSTPDSPPPDDIDAMARCAQLNREMAEAQRETAEQQRLASEAQRQVAAKLRQALEEARKT